MPKGMKLNRISGSLALMCLLILPIADGAAQDDKLTREVYQAQAMGQSTQLGKSFNVTINVEQYSTAEERQILVDAF